MRKIILLLLVAISCSIYAQDYYRNLFEKGKEWNWSNVWDMEFHGTYFFDRDTLLGGKECQVFSREYVNRMTASKMKKDSGIFYEEDGKVYRWDAAGESFSLYYDFTAELGDTIRWGNSPVRLLEVTCVDSVELRGQKLRRLTFKNLTDAPDSQKGAFTGQWIEGIGGDLGFLSYPYIPPNDGYRFMDCLYDGKVICDCNLFTDTTIVYDKRMLSYDPCCVSALSGGGTSYGKEVVVRTGMEQSMIMQSGERRSRFTTFDVMLYGSGEENTAPETMEMKLYEQKGKIYVVQPFYQNYILHVFPDVGEPYTHLGIPPESVLLYDFTLEAGDRYPCRGEVYVWETGTMTARDGLERRTMVLTNGLVLIEGIGCVNSPLGLFGYQNQTGAANEVPAACMEFFGKDGLEGSPLYLPGDVQLLSVGDMVKELRTGCPAIYDLQGRQLVSPPEKGLYVRDGKKYVK